MSEEVSKKAPVVSAKCPQDGSYSNRMKAANMWRCTKNGHEFSASWEN